MESVGKKNHMSANPKLSARAGLGASIPSPTSISSSNDKSGKYRREAQTTPGGSRAFDGDAPNGLNQEAFLVAGGHHFTLVESTFGYALK